MNKLVYTFLFLILISSCSEYQKALKTEDKSVIIEVATKLYDAGKYYKAIRLFEKLVPDYKGKPQGERMFYMYSQSLYKTEQYSSSSYQFESFAALYPKSQKHEEALFLSADSYAKLSPSYTLDQEDTDKALGKVQNFINTYPKSQYLGQANEIVKKLNDKLEKKAYEIAKQYNTISDYKASIKALDNFLSDYPGTSYKEGALFYKLDSCYKLAINSVASKMEDRLNAAKIAHANLLQFNKNTVYKKPADKMLERIEKDLVEFSKK